MGSERGYFFSAVAPALCAIIGSAIYGWVDYDPDYKSEWLTADSSFVFSIVPAVFNGLFLCLLAFSIFLNRLDKISNHFIWSALSWFLLPTSWIFYLLMRDQGVFILLNTLPYLIGLSLSFWRFRKHIAKSKCPPLEIITKENRKINTGSSVDNSTWG